MPTCLHLTLRDPSSGERRLVATLRWPAHLEGEARAFLRDNLLVERTGSPRAAEQLLKDAVITPAQRASFLADRPGFRPDPPERLASELELEDLVADFGVALSALRGAPAHLELVLEWR